jgi:hypothetical protein
MNENDSVWIILNVLFGTVSVIGAVTFVACFNFAIYKRNRRIAKKVFDDESKGFEKQALNSVRHSVDGWNSS